MSKYSTIYFSIKNKGSVLKILKKTRILIALLLVAVVSMTLMVQCVSSASTSFSDGFENGLVNWTDTTTNPTPILTNEQKNSGSYSLKVTADSGVGDYAYKAFSIDTRIMYFQVHARLSAPIAYGDNRFMVCADKNSNFIAKISIYYDKTNSPKLHILDALHNQGGVYSISWTPNTWHEYTVMINAVSQGSINVWYDGSLVGSLNGDFSSAANLGTLLVGSYKSDQATTNYIDDVSIGTSSPFALTSKTPVTYFQSTFSYASTGSYAANQNWPSQEPAGYKIEKGTWNWVNTGDSADMKLVVDPATGNSYCLNMVLDYPGTRPLSINQQAKLYNIPSRETQNWNGVQDSKEVYYTMKYWFPADFSVATHSWRLIWQLNGEVNVYGNPQYTYSPQMALIFGDKDLELQASGYYYTDGASRAYSLINNVDLPKAQWVQITVYVKQGSAFRAQDGTVAIWINGKQVFSSNSLSTSTVSGTPYSIWSIANYGGPYEAQNQYFLIKDVMATNYLP
jgi:hypothetical protein